MDWKRASNKYITEGIAYLKKVPAGRPKLEARQRDRVGCSWGAAIIWCNNVCENPLYCGPITYTFQTDHVLFADSWGVLADGATLIRDACSYDEVKGDSIMGQVFNREFDVRIRYDKSDGC